MAESGDLLGINHDVHIVSLPARAVMSEPHAGAIKKLLLEAFINAVCVTDPMVHLSGSFTNKYQHHFSTKRTYGSRPNAWTPLFSTLGRPSFIDESQTVKSILLGRRYTTPDL